MKKYLFLLILFVLFIPNVNAIPSGEYYSEFASQKTDLGGVIGSTGEYHLYGYNPQLNLFNSGANSLVSYDRPNVGVYSSFRANPTNIVFNKDYTYSGSVRFTGSAAGSWVYQILGSSNDGTRDNCIYESISSSKPLTSSCSCVHSSSEAVCTFTFKRTSTNYGFVVSGVARERIDVNFLLANTSGVYLPTNWSITQPSGDVTVNVDTSGIITQQQQTNQAINDMNSNITSDSIEDPNNTLSNLQDQISTNNVISDLLLLPVTLYQKIINSLNGSCSPFNLGTLYKHNLTLPCINLQSYLGSSIFTTIDLILSGLFVLVIRKKFVDIFNNMTNLKNGGNEVE